ncbi:MAG: SCO family protein [Gemmatimonadaceae bacterium]|nr:SCO family protein [Gemmatimonadaceae bacterium]
MSERGAWRAVAGGCASLVAAVAALWWATAGFSAITYDGAKAARLASRPRAVPRVRLVTADGAVLALPLREQVTIVDFVSTSCVAVCLAQGASLQALQRLIRERGLVGRVALLSVSFDPDDDAGRLDGFAATRGLAPDIWRIARADGDARRALLDTFDIRIVRDPLAGWRHNAALHIVDRDGALRAVHEVADVRGALRTATQLTETP